jgi:hypothetical protein
MPEDLDQVMGKGDINLAAFVFSPEDMNLSLLTYIRQNTHNAELKEGDLTISLVIAKDTHYCKSLVISTQSGDKKQIVFNITNSGSTPTLQGFALPTSTVLYSTALAKENNAENWKTKYFTQISVKSFERDR